jgi:hypothetical protein
MQQFTHPLATYTAGFYLRNTHLGEHASQLLLRLPFENCFRRVVSSDPNTVRTVLREYGVLRTISRRCATSIPALWISQQLEGRPTVETSLAKSLGSGEA